MSAYSELAGEIVWSWSGLSQALQIAIVLANSRESDAMTKLADRKDKATAWFEAIILVTGAKSILVSYISSP